MKRLKLIFCLMILVALTSCTGLTPTAGANVGIGIDLTKKMPVRPYVSGGLNLGVFKFI